MFTGIVEEMGQVEGIQRGKQSAVLTIRAKTVLEGTKIGDSIAVNGVCLTVTSLLSDRFSADVMHETLDRSALAGLRRGSLVNLERAMAADGRFGGHIVAGHIDGTGKIVQYRKEENAVWVEVETSGDLLRLIVEKGSICMDGISLTVAAVGNSSFQVSVIPHTGEETTLLKKRAGSLVNLETDIIGKYVEKLIKTEKAKESSDGKDSGGMTMEFLETYL